MDAGSLTTVEVGQYLQKTLQNFQFTDAVACREYTLNRANSLQAALKCEEFAIT